MKLARPLRAGVITAVLSKLNLSKRSNKMFKKKYPLPIYVLMLAQLIGGIDLIGTFMVRFFRDWGGITQTETQTLQSLFLIFIFILEIPTGVFGDRKGLKFSVLSGYAIIGIATVIYGLIPDFRLFVVSEFLFALGVSFISGAEEALVFETAKRTGVEKDFGKIQVVRSNLEMISMIAGTGIAALLAQSMIPYNRIFQMQVIPCFIVFVLLLLVVKEPREHKSQVPDYKEIIGAALKEIRTTKVVKLVTILLGINLGGYFVIWLYQVALESVNVNELSFGSVRIVLLVAEMVFQTYAIKALKLNDPKTKAVLAAIVAAGFILVATRLSIETIYLFVIVSGGIGATARTVFSPELNEEVSSENRATALSGISMLNRISIAVFNPFIGFLADKSVSMAFLAVSAIVIAAIAIFLLLNRLLTD